VVEIEKSDLAAEDVQANEGRRDKAAAIKAHSDAPQLLALLG
jgi:hypothetical protein